MGDHLIICTDGSVPEAEVPKHIPRVLLIGEGNSIKEIKKFNNRIVEIIYWVYLAGN